MDGVGVQVVFSSIPSVAEKDTERSRKSHLINTWLKDWCKCKNLFYFIIIIFFNHGAVYLAPDLMAGDGSHLSQRRK